MSNNHLLVTVADENYVEQAKQLFSSAYWNGGWDGDYLLLATEVAEEKLKWFEEKGILVIRCKPLSNAGRRFPPAVLSKFYMYTESFKKWSRVVYMDADVIVRASIGALLEESGFAAVANYNCKTVGELLEGSQNLIKHDIDLESASFCAGVFTFTTNMIEENTFERLLEISQRIQKGESRDQPAHNLYFCNRWKKLPLVYDVQMNSMVKRFNVPLEEVDGIVLHFTGADKPWQPSHPFYSEWKRNKLLAEEMEIKKASPRKVEWSSEKIASYSNFIESKKKEWEKTRKI